MRSESIWGVREISADLLPEIPLSIGTIDENRYGYSESPTRFTGARFSFEVDSSPSDHILELTGWDITRDDETRVLLNDSPIGFLTRGLPSAYNDPDKFLLPSSLLNSGKNTIRLVQRVPDSLWRGFIFERWAVREVSVSIANTDLAVSGIDLEDRFVFSNRPFRLNFTIDNLGETASTNTLVNFVVSSDSTISFSDTPISSTLVNAIDPGQRVSLTSPSLTTNLVNKNFYIGICVEGAENEIISSNNCSSGISLQNNAYIPPIIDLILERNGVE